MAGNAEVLTRRAQEIVVVARALLERGGPEALSMRAVAGELGIQAPSLYNHLPDKAALEAAIIASGFIELDEVFATALAGASDPLAALADAYRGWGRAHPHLYRLSTDRPLPRDRLAPGVEEGPARVVVDACGGDPDAARAVFAFAHGMVMLELADRFPPGADIDAAWRSGIAAFRPEHKKRKKRKR